MKTPIINRVAAVAPYCLALLLLASVSVTAATNGTGFTWQYDAPHQQVTLTTEDMTVRVTTGGEVPHFLFWATNTTGTPAPVTYHVQFHQLIEFNDTNDDGTYTPGTDIVARPILSLAAIRWNFSGFITDQEDDTTTAVHFNFTLEEVQGPGYDDLFVQLRVHMNASSPDELKFDIVISGWPWAYPDTSLALRWDLMVQLPGQHTYQHAHQTHYENRTCSFDGAYFSYRNTANAGNTEVPVNSSIDEQTDRTRFYIVYPHFSDETLEHDPTIGLVAPTTPIPGDLVVLFVVGAGALACGVIAAFIIVRRRN
ncbi:MAG: hypothetical protein ACFFCO_05605 [Promethearchaeota archaeon]